MLTTRTNVQRLFRWSLAATILLFPAALSAADVVPHVFSPGTRIVATEVNENFQHVLRKIDEKESLLLGRTIRGDAPQKAALTVENSSIPSANCDSGGGGAIIGRTGSHFCGGRGYAAVMGQSTAPSFAVGVLGTAGNSTADNAVGVLGMATGANAAGLATWGSGVQLNGGGIRVNTAWKPLAFTHTASAANSQANVTCIDQELTNKDANAVLTVSHRLQKPPVYLNVAVCLLYNDSTERWCIHAEDGTTSLVGHTFNVVVINTYYAP